MINRRWTLAGICLTGLPWVQAKPEALPTAQDLTQEVWTAFQAGQPLVVMVSLAGCSFCHTARQSYLLPLWRAGAAVVQVDMRSSLQLKDFQGQVTTHDELTRRWKVTKAPTLLFFGPGGRELAERMAGAYIPDFYGAYLDDRLAWAKNTLRR